MGGLLRLSYGGTCIGEYDFYYVLRMLPIDGGAVHVDLYQGEREYDIIMVMYSHGLVFASHGGGLVDRVAITPSGVKHMRWLRQMGYHRKRARMREEIASLTEVWNKAFERGNLPWQQGKSRPYS